MAEVGPASTVPTRFAGWLKVFLGARTRITRQSVTPDLGGPRSSDLKTTRAGQDRYPLVLERLGKTYARGMAPAIDGVEFSVAAGEVLGLVGLNGAGKTTTIRIAAGLVRPSEGRVVVGGHDMVREKELASRHVGLVSESPTFDPMARPVPLLLYFGGFYGMKGPSARRRCLELLDLVGLSNATSKRFGAFSHGMKKRFAIAAALVGDPNVLLLDETLSGLDPEGVAFVRDMIRSWRTEGRAILLSSHQLNEIEALSDRVAIIHHGKCVRLVALGPLIGGAERTLRISILDLDDRALSYLSGLGDVRRRGDTVWIRPFTGESGEVSFELAKRGFHVSSLTVESPSLEDLFFDQIEAESDRLTGISEESHDRAS